jgi:trehalose 6-phosphate phosphatase
MPVRSNLQAPPGLDKLSETGPLALFLDFDGTLVEIAELPSAIIVPDDLADRLARLSNRLDGRLALISGRAIADLERHLGSLQVARAGSHGIARMLADGAPFGEEPDALPAAAGRSLRAFAAAHGLTLEEKPHGAALHYRAARHLEEAGIDFADRLANLHGLSVKRGNCVIELVRPGADKGGAVRAFMGLEPFAGSRPVFIGDDITDEDGFSAAAELGGFGVLVGDRRPTAAGYSLADTAAVHDWLGL